MKYKSIKVCPKIDVEDKTEDLIFSVSKQPNAAAGSVTIDANGKWTFTPKANSKRPANSSNLELNIEPKAQIVSVICFSMGTICFSSALFGFGLSVSTKSNSKSQASSSISASWVSS